MDSDDDAQKQDYAEDESPLGHYKIVAEFNDALITMVLPSNHKR